MFFLIRTIILLRIMIHLSLHPLRKKSDCRGHGALLPKLFFGDASHFLQCAECLSILSQQAPA